MPYFDYCSTLCTYYSKYALQKLCNCYYACTYKLFKFKFCGLNDNETNDFLKEYNLLSFQHRLLFRLLYIAN